MKKLIILIIPILSLAHPHLFIDTKLDFIIKKNRIEKLNITWAFDDMNSQIFMMDYDSNRDKKLDKKEMKQFKISYFDKLSKSKYFSHIKIDGKEIELFSRINGFRVEYKKSLLIVNFAIDFEKIKQKDTVDIGFWDEENYTAFTINRTHIKFKGKPLKTEMDFHYADLFVADILRIKL